jgi:hypothetical protein
LIDIKNNILFEMIIDDDNESFEETNPLILDTDDDTIDTIDDIEVGNDEDEEIVIKCLGNKFDYALGFSEVSRQFINVLYNGNEYSVRPLYKFKSGKYLLSVKCGGTIQANVYELTEII